MNSDPQTLVSKLNPACRKGLEKAAYLCVSHTNYNVELEHFFLALLDIPETDITIVFRHYDIRHEDVLKELTLAVEKFKRGNSHTPALSQYIIDLLEKAWSLSSLQFGSDQIRSGFILIALLEDKSLRGILLESSLTFRRIPLDLLRNNLLEIIQTSSEEHPSVQTPSSRTEQPVSGKSHTPELDKYTIDLTARAKTGLIDPIQGRDTEIRQIIDILTRRRQNNPILTGEAGVGKTAVVEGFAIRIAKGDVPPMLQNVSLRLLDLGLLQAGAGVKGEFEKRLKSVIDEVKGSSQPIILFIDEAHTLIGAGGSAGMGDAANLLKPALARGELRTIAATTWSEYKKYFEKDPALTRRFQVIQVDEPGEESAVGMLRGLVSNLEAHHNVIIMDEAVQDAVRLSLRYISGRQLPDKAISVLDTACARVGISQNATPPDIEYIDHRKILVETELGILKREQASGLDHADRIDVLSKEVDELKQRQDVLNARWQDESDLVKQVLKVQKDLEQVRSQDGDISSLQSELGSLKDNLRDIQQNQPMINICVDSDVVADVISDWTGIPVGNMLVDEVEAILSLKQKMEERIIGQPDALDAVCRRIQTSRADLDDPGKPVGVFLLIGPSGIGKTETAVALADILYGGEQNMIALNMSEYQERHTVSGLKGSPPGYVGYGQGGVLTEPVRRKPYSVVLLDEVEKAHSDVMELFYQVFDKGVMEDAEGLRIDFKNTLILLTSNLGSERIAGACRNPGNIPDPETLLNRVRPELLKHFKPAFLGRLVIVPYYPLTDEVIQKIVRLKLDKIKKRFEDNHRIIFSYSNEMVETVASRCTEVDTGARNVDCILTQTLLPEISEELLKKMIKGETCSKIHVNIDENGNFIYDFQPLDEQPATCMQRDESEVSTDED